MEAAHCVRERGIVVVVDKGAVGFGNEIHGLNLRFGALREVFFKLVDSGAGGEVPDPQPVAGFLGLARGAAGERVAGLALRRRYSPGFCLVLTGRLGLDGHAVSPQRWGSMVGVGLHRWAIGDLG